MRRTIFLALAAIAIGASAVTAQQPPPTTAPPAGQRVGPAFVDANGDGICDNYQVRQNAGQHPRRGRGPGDGTGNSGVGPRDGTGYGAGAGRGTGICTGTCTAPGSGRGPQHRGGRR